MVGGGRSKRASVADRDTTGRGRVSCACLRASTITTAGSTTPSVERGVHAGDDRVGGQLAVREEHLDQGAWCRRGRRDGGEPRSRTARGSAVNDPAARARASGVAPSIAPGLSSGPRGSGPAPAPRRPCGPEHGAATTVAPSSTSTVSAPTRTSTRRPTIAGRDRVETAADRHPALAVDPVRAHHAWCRTARPAAAAARGASSAKCSPTLDPPVRDAPSVVAFHRRRQQLVELGHRRDVRDRDEMAAAEPADLALHAALLVAALDAGLTEEAVEAVVRPQRDEPFRLDPVAALQHLRRPPPSSCRSGSAPARHRSARSART